MAVHPKVSELESHLNEGVRRDFARLDESLAEVVEVDDAHVEIVCEMPCTSQLTIDHKRQLVGYAPL